MPKLIDGVSYDITAPYAEGHVLTAIEAKVLNQVRAENIGNNVRAKVKELHSAKRLEDAKTYVYDADKSYAFTAGAAAARKLEPIEREARAIAKSAIVEHLAKTGRKISVAPAGETAESWDEKIENQIETLSQREDIVLLARRRLADKKPVIAEALSSLG
jgi:hypothetical protein